MIAITGGGTGGHLSIAKTLKEEFNKKGIKPVFIGSSNGQDRAWFENEEGFEEKYFFNTKGVVNQNKIGKIISLSNILLHSLKCYGIFKKYDIKKVVSVGGYSAAAASFGAVIFKKELFIHEQNAKTGALNNKLLPYAKAFFSSYDKRSPIKDYPVRENFFKTKRLRKELGCIIFLGGSQGAHFINNLAKELSKPLLKKGVNIIHQCGKKEYQELKEFYKKKGLEVELYDFIKDMPSMLSRADLAISRSGASTLWELCANALPTLFFPYPYAAGDHQYYNAKFLKDKNLAYLFRENEIKPNEILNLIESINLSRISTNLTDIIHKDAAKKIAEYILSTSPVS